MIALATTFDSPAIAAALADLRRDLAAVLPTGHLAAGIGHWSLDIGHSAALAAETFVVEVTADRRIVLTGGDELGAIYAIYEFSHRFLGVDPLWFWKDIAPAPLAAFAPAPQRIESGPPRFRYRGWFINDEDLLGRWREPAGERFRDWPKRAATLAATSTEAHDHYEQRLLRYYTPVIAADTMEMIFEAALRLRINLIIPASFIDILNPPEADVVRAALRRGLFVSQHHVEPLGVSHFAYETWCAKHGHAGAPFSYREAPEVMRACWQAYAERWHEVASDKVIWQVGLRGRGDRPLWSHDPEAQARAAEFVASALADQMAIIRSVDARRQPPVTLTLWFEGAELIKSGRLRAPDGVTYVFADHHVTQEMQEDFQTLPREPGRGHGVYYHVAVWTMGPHLVQGPSPEKISRTMEQVAARGDTAYAILNIANLREHVMGATVWSEFVWRNHTSTTSEFLARWSPLGLAGFHARLLDCVPEFEPGWRFYDGSARSFLDNLIRHHAAAVPLGEKVLALRAAPAPLAHAVEQLSALLADLETAAPTVAVRHRAFCETNLVVQTSILLGLYRAVLALLASPPDFAAAESAIASARAALPRAEQGRFRHWYRGDTKIDFAGLSARIAALSSRSPTNALSLTT